MFLFQTLTGFVNNMIAILLISYFVINIVLIEYYELVLRFQERFKSWFLVTVSVTLLISYTTLQLH